MKFAELHCASAFSFLEGEGVGIELSFSADDAVDTDLFVGYYHGEKVAIGVLAGLFLSEQPDEHVREAKDSVRHLPCRCGQIRRQRIEGAVGEAVTVEQGKLGHGPTSVPTSKVSAAPASPPKSSGTPS